MSHTDYVAEAPAGFKIIAHTDVCPVAAIANEERNFMEFNSIQKLSILHLVKIC